MKVKDGYAPQSLGTVANVERWARMYNIEIPVSGDRRLKDE